MRSQRRSRRHLRAPVRGAAALTLLVLVLGGLGLVAPAFADTTVTITGQVTRSGDGRPVGRAVVSGYGESAQPAQTTTTAEGYYSISVPVEGAEAVVVCAAQDGDPEDQTLVGVCESRTGAGSLDLQLQRTTSVRGTIDVAPLGATDQELAAALFTYDSADGWSAARTTTLSPTTGRYQFAGVADGNYRVCLVEAGGVLDPETFGCAGGPQVEDADDVLVRGTSVVENFSAAARGQVRGTLAGPSGTAEIASGVVEVYRVVGDGRGGVERRFATEQYTDQNSYSVTLVPGRYRIRFTLFGSMGHIPVWNGGATSFASASDIVVSSGGTVTADVVAPLAGSISGRILTPTNTEVSSIVAVNAASGAHYYGLAPDQFGYYSIDGLPTGSYRVELDRVDGVDLAAQLYADKPESVGAASADQVGLTVGQKREGIDATLIAGRKATGRVQAADGTAVTNATVLAYTDDEHLVSRSSQTIVTGQFSVPGLQVSGYKIAVDLYGDGQGLYFLDSSGRLTSDRSAAATRTVESTGLALGTLTLPAGSLAAAPYPLDAPTVSGSPTVGSTLTARPGTWSSSGLTFTYRWWRDGSEDAEDQLIEGATTDTYRPSAQDTGHRLYAEVFASEAGTATGRAETEPTEAVGSAPRITRASAPTLSTPQPVVAQAVTVSGGTWSVTPTSTSYQWYRDSTPVQGATGASYTPVAADEGQTLSVVEVVQRSGYLPGSTEVRADGPTRSSGSPQVVTSLTSPVVGGAKKVGATLATTAGTWTAPGRLTYTYQWVVDGVAVGEETDSTYVLRPGDVGKSVVSRVTASLPTGASATADSEPYAPIGPGDITSTSPPTIRGPAIFGRTLIASNGSWDESSGLSYTYQWLAGGVAISGATANTYTLTAAEVGKSVTVQVTASKTGRSSGTAESLPTAVVAPATTTNVEEPVITGTAQSGSTLSASTGTWVPAGPLTFDFQWYVGGAEVAGATGSTYVIGVEDVGKAVSVRVGASRPGYATAYALSASTATVVAATLTNTGRPVVTGTAKVDAVLTATRGTWSLSGLDYAYQWYAGSTPIEGATSSSYRVASSQRGQTLSVRVRASKPGYAPVVVSSAATGPVVAATFAVAGPPSTSGAGAVGSQLTYVRAQIAPTPTSYRLQWLRNGVPTAATSRSYSITAADRGTTVSLRVTYARPGYVSVTLTTAGVAIPPT